MNATSSLTLEASLMSCDPRAQRGELFRSDQLPSKGRTDLGLAAAKGEKEELARLINLGANPSEADAFQETPLHLAAQFGHLEVVKVLVKDYRVDVDPVNWEGWTPLCCAVSRGHLAVIKYLLRSKADGEWKSPLGWNLMHIAAWYNQEELIVWLASNGAPTATESEHGCRPFDLTRPGRSRQALYHAMVEERKSTTTQQ